MGLGVGRVLCRNSCAAPRGKQSCRNHLALNWSPLERSCGQHGNHANSFGQSD